jgi:DNA-binding transcriptional ArsR family regulator
MEERAGTYYLESVEQLRAIADALRIRILEALQDQPRTVTQIADLLGLPANKVHYHVRELERVGLLILAETRERGGILEKYYRPVAESIQVPKELLARGSPDENIAAFAEILQHISDGALQAIRRKLAADPGGEQRISLSLDTPWLTNEELDRITGQLAALLKAYAQPRGLPGERQRTITLIAHDAAGPRPADDSPIRQSIPRPEPAARPTRALGVLAYNRADLERLVERHEQLDIAMTGVIIFAGNIPPELADQAIRRVRCRGKIIAPPALQDVLERKGATIA